jgi:hypothetical protein
MPTFSQIRHKIEQTLWPGVDRECRECNLHAPLIGTKIAGWGNLYKTQWYCPTHWIEYQRKTAEVRAELDADLAAQVASGRLKLPSKTPNRKIYCVCQRCHSEFGVALSQADFENMAFTEILKCRMCGWASCKSHGIVTNTSSCPKRRSVAWEDQGGVKLG